MAFPYRFAEIDSRIDTGDLSVNGGSCFKCPIII